MPLTTREPGASQGPGPRGGLTRRTVGGLLWAAWGKGAQAVLHLLVLAVLARLLSPSDFGVVSAALVVIGFSAIFTQLGLGPALVQRPILEQRHLDTAFSFSLGMAVFVGAAVAAGAPLVAAFFQTPQVEPVVRVLALIFPMQGLALVAESLARRELRFRWLANIDVAAYGIAYGVVGVGLALAGWGVWALACAELVRVGVRTAALIVGQEQRPRIAWERAAFGELMYFGGGFTIAKIANYLAVQGDNLVVGRMLGPAAL
nr:oligosaccharide flippase family protein [Gemmatimonadota bacterium]